MKALAPIFPAACAPAYCISSSKPAFRFSTISSGGSSKNRTGIRVDGEDQHELRQRVGTCDL
jgi:hypothetical protein